MRKNSGEFDLERMRVYMAMPAEAKLKHLEEVNAFFSKFRNPKIAKISRQLKARGF